MTRIACRICGADDQLASIERIIGYARIEKVNSLEEGSPGNPDVEYTGWTNVDWDSSSTVGWICEQCGTETETLVVLVKEYNAD